MLIQKEKTRSFIIGWSVIYGTIFTFYFILNSLRFIGFPHPVLLFFTIGYLLCFPFTIFLAFYFYRKERYRAAWWSCFFPFLWTPLFFSVADLLYPILIEVPSY